MINDTTITDFIEKRLDHCDKCPVCKKDLELETYCYECQGNKKKKLDKIISKEDSNLEDYIHSKPILELNTLVGEVRQKHNDECNELFRSKKRVNILKELRHNFDRKVKFTIFNDYSELYKYAVKNLDGIFNNKLFQKKLKIKIDPELDTALSINETDNAVKAYDKQLVLVKTLENIKALIDITMKERMKEQIPSSKMVRYMRYTKKTDGSLNQGKKYAYGHIITVINKVIDNDKNLRNNVIQIFREFPAKNLVKGEKMFIDGMIFLKVDDKHYHPIVVELDDKTHDRLTESKYRLNDIAKNVFCQQNGISMIRMNTSDFNSKVLKKILNKICSSKHAKLAAMKSYEKERKEHFHKLSKTYDILEFLNIDKKE